MAFGPKPPRLTPARQRAVEREAYDAVTARDNGVCARCLRGCGPVTRDHRKGRGVGGRTVVENLQLLGGTGTTGCHGWKTANPADALVEGWTVPGFADPAEWPAARWLPTSSGAVRKAWVLYLPIEQGSGWVEITEAEASERMGAAA